MDSAEVCDRKKNTDTKGLLALPTDTATIDGHLSIPWVDIIPDAIEEGSRRFPRISRSSGF